MIYSGYNLQTPNGKIHTPISWYSLCWRTLCGKYLKYGTRIKAKVSCWSCIRREQEGKRPK